MDILAALEATSTPMLGRRCVIGKFLDGIDDGQAGKDRLLRILTTAPDRNSKSPDWMPGNDIELLLARLGLVTSVVSINAHRANRCKCAH